MQFLPLEKIDIIFYSHSNSHLGLSKYSTVGKEGTIKCFSKGLWTVKKYEDNMIFPLFLDGKPREYSSMKFSKTIESIGRSNITSITDIK